MKNIKKNVRSDKEILEAEVVSRNFGFIKNSFEVVSKDDIKITDSNSKDKKFLHKNLPKPAEILSQIRFYKDNKNMAEPGLYYYEGNAPGDHIKHKKNSSSELINLYSINFSGSIADSLLIKTIQAILSDHGIKNITVKLNDIGNKESQNAFYKESTAYYRKNIDSLNANCRQLFKSSVYDLITNGKNQCQDVHDGAPKPMDFLDEDSRKHFGEILESLEIMNINYEIDQSVLGDPDFSSHIVFEVIDNNTGKTIAAGSRYNYMARKCGLRKDIPTSIATINLPNPKKVTERSLNKIKKSKFFFMQIGYVAKMKSLIYIDMFRKENIPVLHKIYRDRLSTQLASAKKTDCEYYIIVGQKEALDNDIIVRDRESHSQYLVSDKKIVEYLKNL